MFDAITISDLAPTLVIHENSQYPDLLITNDGDRRIFLGDSSALSVGNGYPLDPGSNKVWTQDDGGLWAISDPTPGPSGALPTLRMVTNTGEVFNPTAISTALLAGGLANQIATAINFQGVPPIDQAGLVLFEQQVVPMGAAFTTAIYDASRYNSLSIEITETNGAFGSCLTPREVFIWTYADIGGLALIDGQRFSYFPSNGGILITPSMNRGPFIQVSFAALAAGAANATCTVRVIGSMRTTGSQARVEIWNVNATPFEVCDGDSGLWQMSGNLPVGTTTEYPTFYAGPATLGWEVGNVTTQCYIRLIDQISGFMFASLSFAPAAAAQRGFQTIYLPERAFRVDVLNANAGVWLARFALSMDGNR